MSEAQARSERIRGKIAASQDRLRRDAEAVPPASARAALPDAYPPDSYRSLVAEYPWLVVATGAGLGLLAGALVPKRFGAKLGGRLMTAATLAAELGLAMSRQGGSEPAPAKSELPPQSTNIATQVQQRVAQSAEAVRGTGMMLASEAIRLVARARRK